MATETVTREEREVERVPPLRHLFRLPRPPRPGDVALCGARATNGLRCRENPPITRDHCVVCIELARAQGYLR